MVKTIHSLTTVIFTTLLACGVMLIHQVHADELIVRYKAEDFKGPPKFNVAARKDGSWGAVWRSKTVTTTGGVDTFKFGSNRNRVNWQDAKFNLPANLEFDYVTIRFLNDECCGPTRDGKKFGDRNLFIRFIELNGKKYWATRGTQNTCGRRDTPGEMYCNGTLKIKVDLKKQIDNPKQSVAEQKLTKEPVPQFTKICGIPATGVILNRDKIKTIQRQLKKRGLYSGGIDGIMGSGSCEGLKRFIQIEIPKKDQFGRFISKSVFTYNMMQRLNANPPVSALSKYKTERDLLSCKQNRAIIRSNQTVLKDLGFYTSAIDGLSGPNYRRAVRSGEQLLGTRADDKVGCLNVPERQILSSIYDAGRKGSQCKSIMSVDEVKTTFEQLKASELTKKLSLGYANVGGLMWMIDTVSDLEKRLSFTGFYNETKTSKRDCRLDRDEFDALAPKEPVTLSLAATTLSMTTLDTDSGTTLRLTAGGNDLETSKMSKSVFGGSNQASMDVRFATFKGNPVLDLVISEEDTKINLHLYESGMTNRNLEAQMPELFLDEQPNGWSAFYLRMFNEGSTNIQNGEFAKIVTQMPENDKAMVAALCGQLARVSSSSEGFAASFATPEDRDAFRRSSFSSEPVREAISSLAKQCADEISTKGLVNASFDVEAPMALCSAAQNELLSKLDTEIDEAQTALQGFEDEIKAIQVNRPLFERDACPAYESDLINAQKKLSAVDSEIAQASTSLADLEAKLAEGEDIKGSLSKISQPSELCDVENNGLKDRANGFIQNLNPAAIGIVCPDDTTQSPIQIVIDEINAEITRLLEIHISPDQIAELKTIITQLEAQRVELAANLAAVSQTKASPVEIDQQMQTNAGLSDTVSQSEDQVAALETEITDLRSVMDNNASLIEEIDQLNQELVNLTSQKMLTQDTLDDAKSKVLQAKASVTQLELQIEKARSQTSDLEVQLGAASSTAGTLQQEVQTLTLEVAQTQKRIEILEQEVAVAQDLIDNANSVIASNSQKVAKLDAELNAKNATATTLEISLDTLGPQADAAEQTVRDLEASLKADFVPVAEFKEQEARLNEMTQIVTERTKLIRELRNDLQAIQGEEQLLVKMCLADAQCKAAMGDRLGVE